jgi:hypothetical protein
MAAPTNISAATAIDIAALPYSNIQQVDDAGTTYTVWYKYTAQAGDLVIGAWFFGDLLVYRPETSVFSPNDVTFYLGLDGSFGNIQNKRIQFPVVVGDTYYFQLVPNAGNPAPANLHITVERAPASSYEAGDIFIPVDVFSGGFASAILDPTADNTVRRFVWPFPFGEGGDILENGKMLVQKDVTHTLDLYDSTQLSGGTFALITNVAPGVISTQNPVIRTVLATQRWFFAKWNNAGTVLTVKKIDSDGAILQTWSVAVTASGRAAAASNDEGILYYSHASILGTAIKRYDLNASAPLSDLAAAVAGYGVSDILVLADGTIVVDYGKGGGSPDLFVRRYSPDGTLLHTYTFPNYSGEEHRLAYAIETDSFWVMYMIDTPSLGLARFQRLLTSDGTVLNQRDYVRFDRGIYAADETDTPLAAFGDTNSCPFMILRGATPFVPSAPTRRIIRRLRRAPHLSAEQAWIFYRLFELDLETGVGLSSGQGENPQLMLRWSDDGGHTWSNEHWVTAGRIGQWNETAIWRRLGRSRDRIFEVVVSDPVRWRLLDAYLEAESGLAPL